MTEGIISLKFLLSLLRTLTFQGLPMISIDIPGRDALKLVSAVFDYNGTLAADGKLTAETGNALSTLKNSLDIHILTADTFGSVEKEMDIPGITVSIIGADSQAEQKRDYIRSLGAYTAAAAGNGANDALMLGEAALGICVAGKEGACSETLAASEITVCSPDDALGLLLNPDRIRATLRR